MTDGWRTKSPPNLITDKKSKKRIKEEKRGLFRKPNKNCDEEIFEVEARVFEFDIEVLKLNIEMEEWKVSWERWRTKECEEEEIGEPEEVEQEDQSETEPETGEESERSTDDERGLESPVETETDSEKEDRSRNDKISNEAPDKDKIHNGFDIKDFNVAIMNAGGIKSKQMSISNIVNKFDIRALIVSETHLSGKEKPYINDNMTAFFDNRSDGLNKGGISIFLENSIARKTVIIGKSSSENEWIALKTSYFNIPHM